METKPSLLLVDDNENDTFLFERAAKKSGFHYQIHVARNGFEAQEYLKGDGPYADRTRFPYPKLIVTDNRMPLMSGREFLGWLIKHPQLKIVPIIVLGGDESQASIDEAYENLGVHSYIVKPGTVEELENVVSLIFRYWAICRVRSSRADLEAAKTKSVAQGKAPRTIPTGAPLSVH